MDSTDTQLLDQHRRGEPEAFAQLVRRHINWVYSAARRKTADAHLAEDITQAVFIVLAQSPPTRLHSAALSPWLFGVLIRTCKTTLRAEAIRRRHESEAAKMRPTTTDPQADWNNIAPNLEDAVAKLRHADQQAILLRFYEQLSFAEVGATLGITEEAARKRVSRATEKLRGVLQPSGTTLQMVALTDVLLTEACKPAPAALATTITTIPAGAVATTASAATLSHFGSAIMAWSQTKIMAGVALAALLMIGGAGIVLHRTQQHGIATAVLPTTQVAEEIPEETHLRWTVDVPKSWYMLAWPDNQWSLHGMPQRLARVASTSALSDTVWRGIESGGQMKLKVEVVGDAPGDILLGFFPDARWSADPVQVRRVSGAGQHVIEHVPPGQYQIGALIGDRPFYKALGVHAAWPTPVDIRPGQNGDVAIRVSTQFKDVSQSGRAPRAWAGDFGQMDESRKVTLAAVDSDGKPISFARIAANSRAINVPEYRRYLQNLGTNEQGFAYFDHDGQPFSIGAQRYDFDPQTFIARYLYQRFGTVYEPAEHQSITVRLDPFPAGSGALSGKVEDQFGRPLREFNLTIVTETGDPQGVGAYRDATWSVPVISNEGKYEVNGLPPGDYRVTVRPADIGTHVGGQRMNPYKVTIPASPSGPVQLDIRLEAKMLYFGRAIYANGSPISSGYWIAETRLVGQRDFEQSGPARSGDLEPDGLFRVALAAGERQQLIAISQGKVQIHNNYQDTAPLGEILLSDLGTSREHAPVFRFAKPRVDGR